MNILIVGGTRFQGRHLVRELLDNHHHVTVFHTGRHTLPPTANLVDLIGNRDDPAHLERLSGRAFDACIDTCAYFGDQVDLLNKYIAPSIYCLISTVNVYKDQGTRLPESAQLMQPDTNCDRLITPGNYGGLKVLCEERAHIHFNGRCLVIRPTVLIGAGDHTERLAFWIRLIAKHHKLLSVPDIDGLLQFVDVRDLAWFTAKLIQDHRVGTVNVVQSAIRFSEFTSDLAGLAGVEPDVVKVLAKDLPSLGLADLPYFDTRFKACFMNTLAESWGFRGRSLKSSLEDFFQDAARKEFQLNKYSEMESKVLNLFS